MFDLIIDYTGQQKKTFFLVSKFCKQFQDHFVVLNPNITFVLLDWLQFLRYRHFNVLTFFGNFFFSKFIVKSLFQRNLMKFRHTMHHSKTHRMK